MFSYITGWMPIAGRITLVAAFHFWTQVGVAQELAAPLPPPSVLPGPSANAPSPQAAGLATQPSNSSQPPIPADMALQGLAPTGNNQTQSDSLVHHIQSPTERMEMTVNSSRVLTLDQKIPRAQVNNREILELTALSPNEIQVLAKKAGVTQINLWNEKGQVYTVDCIVYGDARELAELLRSEFPSANLHVRPMNSSVLLTGFVDRADQVSQIIQIAQDYYPKVVPNISVGGVEQIQLHVKVAEVSRTRARDVGFDFASIQGGNFLGTSISNMLAPGTISGVGMPAANGDTLRFGIVSGNTAFFGFLDALRRENLLKILADPTLVTVSGRPAQFKVGGEVPYPANATLNGVSVSYKDTGITVDFVPIILGNGNIRLEVRPIERELDETKNFEIAPGFFAPGFTLRQVDTGVEMRPGQTLAIAGLVEKKVKAEKREIPWIGELPYIGAAFRQVKQEEEEIELLFLVTPEVVAGLDCNETPQCFPAMHTDAPNDCEEYLKGYIEVPSDGPCGPHGCGIQGGPGDFGGSYPSRSTVSSEL